MVNLRHSIILRSSSLALMVFLMSSSSPWAMEDTLEKDPISISPLTAPQRERNVPEKPEGEQKKALTIEAAEALMNKHLHPQEDQDNNPRALGPEHEKLAREVQALCNSWKEFKEARSRLNLPTEENILNFFKSCEKHFCLIRTGAYPQYNNDEYPDYEWIKDEDFLKNAIYVLNIYCVVFILTT